MGKVISVINFKGGVGKTTLSVNLAACLAKIYKHETLLIDLDPQSNASTWLLGIDDWKELNERNDINETSYGLFRDRKNKVKITKPFPKPTGPYIQNLSLLPATFKMIALEDRIFTEQGMRRISGDYKTGDEYDYLTEPIEDFKSKYDFIIVDSPPNIYTVTRNIIRQSDYILVPCIPDTLSTSGLNILLFELGNFLKSLLEKGLIEKTPKLLGVIITKRKRWNEHEKGVNTIYTFVDEASKIANNPLVEGEDLVLDDYSLSEYSAHTEAVQLNQPLCLCRADTKAYKEMKSLTQALVDRMESN
jgi:chromosome partitioning protein